MVSHERVEEMLQEEIKKVKDLGIIVEPISPVVEFPKAKSFYGMCHHQTRKVNGKTYYNYIRISEYFLEASELEIRGTLIHEILHACKETIHEGHGTKWKELAKKVNSAYPEYDIKRLGSQIKNKEDYSLRAHAPAACSRVKHEIECTTCGNKWRRTRDSKLSQHTERYFCPICRRAGRSGVLKLNF